MCYFAEYKKAYPNESFSVLAEGHMNPELRYRPPFLFYWWQYGVYS